MRTWRISCHHLQARAAGVYRGGRPPACSLLLVTNNNAESSGGHLAPRWRTGIRMTPLRIMTQRVASSERRRWSIYWPASKESLVSQITRRRMRLCGSPSQRRSSYRFAGAEERATADGSGLCTAVFWSSTYMCQTYHDDLCPSVFSFFCPTVRLSR